jgi:hypothetical protein
MSIVPKRLLEEYTVLLTEVKERIRSAQYAALRTVNKELVGLYWDIGKMISERQKRHSWGKSVVEHLPMTYKWNFQGLKDSQCRIYGT